MSPADTKVREGGWAGGAPGAGANSPTDHGADYGEVAVPQQPILIF